MSTAPLPPDIQHAIETGYSHLVANKYYVLATTVMLFYDHILTFEQERKYIWCRKITIPTLFFFVFRYATPVVSLVNLIAEHDPGFTGAICANWIWMPVAIAPIVSGSAGVILILRVYAIYGRAQWILWVLVPLHIVQLAVMGWAVPAGIPANLPDGFVGCVPSRAPGSGFRLSSIFIAALVFDAVVFGLTLGMAFYVVYVKKETTVKLFRVIVRDGTLYFAMLFAVNLTTFFFLALATEDLSAINAPMSTILTALLVSRLVLNLRQASDRNRTRPHTRPQTLTWRVDAMSAMMDFEDFNAPLGEHDLSGMESSIAGSGSHEDDEVATTGDEHELVAHRGPSQYA